MVIQIKSFIHYYDFYRPFFVVEDSILECYDNLFSSEIVTDLHIAVDRLINRDRFVWKSAGPLILRFFQFL